MTIRHGGNIFALSRRMGWNWRDVADFSASINPLGPAPGVAAAIEDAIERVVHYPESDSEPLRQALATKWNIAPEQVLPGNGATELLHFFARSMPRREVTLSSPVFSEFERAYPRARRIVSDDPEEWPRRGLLVLSQPDNPRGRAHDPSRLREWLLATRNPVMIDESFLEFTGLASSATLLERRPRLYILRSLTKFHALPGLRMGALLSDAVTVARWRAEREPWQVNVLAEAAALAALADDEHARRTLEFVAAERAWLSAQLNRLPGVSVAPACANYVLARLDYPAEQLAAHLFEARILVRICTGQPGVEGEAVRIAVRTRAEHERLLTSWGSFAP